MGAATVTLPGWRVGSGRRLAGLAVARLANQAIGVAWFVMSARILDESQFGTIGAALAIVVVVGALSDLGATRTLVRHITSDQRVLWPAYRRALAQRLVVGSLLGGLTVALLAVVGVDVSTTAVALAAAIALASGITELAFAALRAVGLVRVEMALLVGERAAFAVVAGAIVIAGGGAVPVLVAYLVTNALSAVVGFGSLVHLRAGSAATAPPLLDREGRRTAIASTLVTLGPRVSTLVLIVVASPAAVGTLTIAQKAPEAVGVFAAAVLAPVLAMVRPDVLAGDRSRAAQRSVQVLGALLFVLGPVLVWMALRPDDLLGLVFDAAGRDGATASMTACAVAAFLLLGRTVGEQLLLADDRAGAYVVALATGCLVALGTAIAFVPEHGPTGAAVAALAGEAAAAALVLARLDRFRASGARRSLLAPVALTVAVAGALVVLPSDARAIATVIVAIGSVAGVARAREMLHVRDRR
jgi:O-antigen/teichoic acid export membrane protein